MCLCALPRTRLQQLMAYYNLRKYVESLLSSLFYPAEFQLGALCIVQQSPDKLRCIPATYNGATRERYRLVAGNLRRKGRKYSIRLENMVRKRERGSRICVCRTAKAFVSDVSCFYTAVAGRGGGNSSKQNSRCTYITYTYMRCGCWVASRCWRLHMSPGW